jgi:hypothetical protein
MDGALAWCLVAIVLGGVALEAAKEWGANVLWFMGYAAIAVAVVFLLATGGG